MKKIPFISRITLITMIIGLIVSWVLLSGYIMISIGSVWAICTAVLFLVECLFGLMKRQFSANIGAFIATTIMGVAFIVMFPRGSESSAMGRDLACIAFLPPIITSFAANIGNVIYKLTHGKPIN